MIHLFLHRGWARLSLTGEGGSSSEGLTKVRLQILGTGVSECWTQQFTPSVPLEYAQLKVARAFMHATFP